MTYLGCLSYDEMNHFLEVSLSLHLLYTERAMCLKLSLRIKKKDLQITFCLRTWTLMKHHIGNLSCETEML